MERIPDCTGVLVAGGAARRLGGIAKGRMRVGGTPVAARSLDLLRALFGEVLVVANDPGPWRDLGAPVVPDVLPGKGAPGGLHAALSTVRTGWIFAAACDMPFLDERPIRALAALRGGAPGVLPEGAHGPEGLHAFWSAAVLTVLSRLLAEGDPSLRAVAAAAGARVVPAEEWKRLDSGGRALENVNTPEDARRLGLDLPEGTP